MKILKLNIGPLHWYHYTIFALTIAGGATLTAYATRSNSSQTAQTEQVQPKKYQYAELGSQCNLAAEKLKQKSESLDAQAEKGYADINSQLAQTEAQLNADSTYNTQALNGARSGYYGVYDQGGISSDEYRQRSDNIGGVQSDLSGQSSSIRSEISRLRTENLKGYQDAKKRAAEYVNDAAKLESCAASANAKMDFAVSDVAEFQSLISRSEQP